MKTLKTIMAVAMVLLITACGGKKEEEAPKKEFDIEKAQKLADYYYTHEFNDKDWRIFANAYNEINFILIENMEKAVENAPADLPSHELLAEFNNNNDGLYELYNKMCKISQNTSSMPEDVAKQIESTNDTIKKRAEQLSVKMEKKFK